MKTLLAMLFAAQCAAATIQPAGFFVMQPLHGNNPPLTDKVLHSPAISGMHVRDKWQLVEPRKGVFDFSFLDQQLARTRSAGKGFIGGIYAGTDNDPAWNDIGSFTRMVAALGARYDGKVTAWHISAPQVTNESMEMYLPPNYSKGNAYAIDIWKQSIDAFNQSFPNTPLVLDIAMAPNSKGAITKAVDDYARQAIGDRLNAIICNLKAGTNIDAAHVDELERMRSLGVRVGAEMVGPSGTIRFGGSFQRALNLGKSLGAEWYQVYQSDIGSIPRLAAGATPEPSTAELLLFVLGYWPLWRVR